MSLEISNLYLFTNNFMSPSNIFLETENDYFDYLPYELSNSEDRLLAQQPILVSKQIFYSTIERVDYFDKAKIVESAKDIHKDNIWFINCSYKSTQDISSLLKENSIKHVVKNLDYSDYDMFESYCEMHGFSDAAVIKELHKRLRGKLSSSLTYIQELSIGTGLNRLIAYEGRANFTKFLGVLLGLVHSKRDTQFFFRVLRREHPNYMRAILRSQLKQLIKMKQNQYKLTKTNMSYADLKIDRKFSRTYMPFLQSVSLPSLLMIKNDLDKRGPTEASILLLKMKYEFGGYVPPNEEVIKWT